MPDTRIPSLVAEFVALFNRGDYWQSHEVLEASWKRSRSDFLHGLILLASAFVHRERKNEHGVLAQLEKAEPLLRRFRPHYLGVDVDQALLLAGELRTMAAGNPIQSGGLATLVLNPGLVRGDEPELDFNE